MSSQLRSVGEALFEKYLIDNHFSDWEFEKAHPGKMKMPDYTVRVNREYCLFDVKEFQPRALSVAAGVYDPYKHIRKKIKKGRDKFMEFKEWPCSVVLYNGGNAPLVALEDPLVMFGAMLGDLGFEMPFDEVVGIDVDSARLTFRGRGEMVQPQTREPRNTTLSALITLRHIHVGGYRLRAHMRKRPLELQHDVGAWLDERVDFDRTERQLGVVVWENPHARIPLPQGIFCGGYDERYAIGRDGPVRRFVGQCLGELERMLETP